MKGQTKTGTITGTGAAMNFELGFTPVRVIVFNAGTAITLEWQDTMPEASGIKTLAAGTRSYVTTNGISRYAGVAGSAAKGFTLGTDSVNTAATLHYVAFGADE
jgi:hypothetical protein